MKQVQSKLFLTLLLAAVVTGQYGSSGGGYGQSYGAAPSSYPTSGYQSASVAQPSYSSYQQPAAPPAYGGSSSSALSTNVASSSYGGSSSYGSGNSGYGSSYGAPTGRPYGIQSTGEYSSYNYYPEKLDLSKCGPTPTENPCRPYGQQYFPLPGNPYCYIQCAFEQMFVKPCPADLVWNARINVCDWPTVAYAGNAGGYESSSYGGSSGGYGAPAAPTASYGSGSAPQQPSSSYSYGRKKRATVERKKRQILPVPPVPLGAPVFPFALPGPVGFPGPLGFPGLPGPIGFPTPFVFPLPYEDDYDYDYDYDYDDYGSKKSYGKKSKKKYGKKYSSYGNKKNSNYGKNDYNSYNRNSYSRNYKNDRYDDDDYYGKSRTYNYKRNGNFQDYRSYKKDRSYGDDSNYYRKRRDYGYNTAAGTQSSAVMKQESFVRIGESKLPLSTLCAGKTTKGNLPHPLDLTKYIACNDDNSQQIMDCPSGLIYNPARDECEKTQNSESICDRENPCLNGGQCYQTSPSTFKCTCRESWTGDRCETQVSACANNPCGEGNTCHTLKTGGFKQDFVCVCDGLQSYGLTCTGNTVPNPCLTKGDEEGQYHPFAFSTQAFIQCNGDILHVQPCAAGSFWSQKRKICDHGDFVETPQLQDQPQSFQLTSNPQQQSAYAPPTAAFPEKTVVQSQGYASTPLNPPVSSYGQTSSYGSSGSSSSFDLTQEQAKSKMITRVTPASSYSNSVPQQFPQTSLKFSEPTFFNPAPQQPITVNRPVSSYGSYGTPTVPTPVRFNVPVQQQYGQRPLPPSQPVVSYGSFSTPAPIPVPFTPSFQQYGQQTGEMFVPQQPARAFNRVLQPEIPRSVNTLMTRTGY